MIIHINGILLTPGNAGKDCVVNGNHTDKQGDVFECAVMNVIT